MTDQEKIEQLQAALAGAVGAIQALAEMSQSAGYPKTAEKAFELVAAYQEALKNSK